MPNKKQLRREARSGAAKTSRSRKPRSAQKPEPRPEDVPVEKTTTKKAAKKS
jgi:hypothetical protein